MVEIPYSPKDPGSIRLLFTRIARNYDTANHVISLGFDVLWRNRFARLFRDRKRIADICCGSGAMMPVLKERILAGLDFTHAMLNVCAEKNPGSRLVEGDAQNIPFASNTFDAAIIVYSIRNIPDTRKALSELYRILQPGALLGILDFGVPKGKILEALYLFYFRKIIAFHRQLGCARQKFVSLFCKFGNPFPKTGRVCEIDGRSWISKLQLSGIHVWSCSLLPGQKIAFRNSPALVLSLTRKYPIGFMLVSNKIQVQP